MKTALVTGFGPYPGVDDNPSAHVVARLRAGAGEGSGVRLRAEILPVAYEAVEARLPEMLSREPLHAVVLTGLRETGGAVCIERVALNLDDCDKPDNDGVVRRGTRIDPHGPPAFLSPLDLDAPTAACERRGIPALVSNHAGAYLCNRVYYLARREIARRAADTPCVFVHVPYLGRPGVTRRDGTPLAVDDLAAAIAAIASLLASPEGSA